jgi:hypothetical protein
MNTKHTIKSMIQFAHSKGGKCLSAMYVNSQSALLWECANKHNWKVKAAHILYGSWCPYCSGRHKTIDDLKAYAATHEGKCCSTEYMGARTDHEWECKYGHRWFAKPTNVLRGTWCGKCKGKYVDIQDCRNLAYKFNGECLENEYVNSQYPMKWQCVDGHIFTKGWTQVKADYWCPYCTRYISEEICRSFMEAAFDNGFPRARPPWLLNSRGNRMELDGYNESLNLAFEHNGQQHYEEGHFTNDLSKRIADDNRKMELCKSHGIKLIIFRNLPLRESEAKILNYLKSTLDQHQIKCPNRIYAKTISIKSIKSNSKLEQLQKIAKHHNGKFLDTQYYGCDHKYQFICEHGHEFAKKASLVKKGAWCPQCAHNTPYTYDQCVNHARRKGGQLLSTSCMGALTPLLWQCENGHIWPQRPANVIAMGTWCPECAKNAPPNIETIEELAIARNGKLISKTYINSKTKLTFKCKFNHQWDALYYNVKKGHWCPTCARRKLNI